MSPKQIIEEFFVRPSDDLYYGNVLIRRSVLLELEKDLDYLTNRQPDEPYKKESSKLNNNQPYIAPVLIYFSAIDLFARIYHKAKPEKNQNGVWFKESAIKFFGFSKDFAKTLWEVRNQISHEYSTSSIVFVGGYYDSKLPVYQKPNSNQYVISIKALLPNLHKAKSKLYNILLNESQKGIEKTEEFISNYFLYHQIK